MPFQKGNKLGAKKLIDRQLDKNPICFIGYEGTKEALKTVPGWQTKLRDYVEKLIKEDGTLPPP